MQVISFRSLLFFYANKYKKKTLFKVRYYTWLLLGNRSSMSWLNKEHRKEYEWHQHFEGLPCALSTSTSPKWDQHNGCVGLYKSFKVKTYDISHVCWYSVAKYNKEVFLVIWIFLICKACSNVNRRIKVIHFSWNTFNRCKTSITRNILESGCIKQLKLN